MLHCGRCVWWKHLFWLLFAMQLAMPIDVRLASGQEVRPQGNTPGVPSAEIQALESDARQAAANPVRASNAGKVEGMNFLTLMVRGGWFMVPIGVVSVLVVAIGLERAYVLRQSRLIPTGLVRSLGALARESESLDPKAAYRLCQQFPSATANVIRTMLLKTGRPHAEVEGAIREALQREADRSFTGVRWLSLFAGIAPLLGLLGTVWGLMRSFHDLSQIGPSQNRSQFLSQGIYEALITTLGGLIVAITASLLAHYFESKIILAYRRIEELMFHLLTQIEPYEGKVRFEAIGKDLVSRDGMAKADAHRDAEGDASGASSLLGTTSSSKLGSSRRAGSVERRDSVG